MVGNNSKKFSTNFIQTGEKEYKQKRSLGWGGVGKVERRLVSHSKSYL